jgi:cell division protein FtsL
MIKLLLCLFSGVALALFMLDIRHRQLELRHQNAELHDKFEAQQAKLWNQQQQIAVLTSPNAIKQTVKGQKMKMVPQYEAQRADWTEPAEADKQVGRGH